MSCPCGCGASEEAHCWNESEDEKCCLCGQSPCFTLLITRAALCNECAARFETSIPSTPPTAVQVSEFTGHASGDMECFCFDRRTYDEMLSDRDEEMRKQIDRDKANRIYPNALLPAGVDRKQGRWRVTVEFWEGGDE